MGGNSLKRLTMIFIMALAVAAACGCTGRAYDSSDKQKLEAVGKKRLEEYFSENLPDAEILSVEAVSADREMTLKVLTNYVRGNYKDDGVTYEYYFDVKNRRMFTSDKFYSLKTKVENKVLQDLGLYDLYTDDKASILSVDINIYLPDVIEIADFNNDVGNESGKLPPANSLMPYKAQVFPYEALDDIEAYVNDKERKETIDVSMTLAVDAAENIDLSDYTFDDFYYEPCEYNIFYSNICIHNAISVTYPYIGHGAVPEIVSRDIVTAGSQGIWLNSYEMRYQLFDDVTVGDTQKHDIIYEKTESLDKDTGNITTKEQTFYE